MTDIKFLIPEIFLSISIFSLLIIGVFLKNSFEIIYKSSMFVIFSLLLIIFTSDNDSVKFFNASFSNDNFSLYSKILISVSTLFILLITLLKNASVFCRHKILSNLIATSLP